MFRILLTFGLLGLVCSTCPAAAGWKYLESTHSCYKFFGVETFTYFDGAEQACNNLGGHLPSIHSEAERMFIQTLTNNTFAWIGLHQADYNSPWVWTDGTPTDYTKWQPTPTPYARKWASDDYHCVGFQENFIVELCSYYYVPYVCQIPATN